MSSDTKTGGRRAIIAAALGNMLEWYDFAVYGFMATILASHFFPANDEVTSLLATFAAFGVGFALVGWLTAEAVSLPLWSRST